MAGQRTISVSTRRAVALVAAMTLVATLLATEAHRALASGDGSGPAVAESDPTPTIPFFPGRLTYSSGPGGDQQIFRLDGATGISHQLTSPEEFAHAEYPAWSPDGAQIAFEGKKDDDSKHQIWVMDADGGNPTQLTNLRYRTGTPRFSPDGTKIAFRSEHQTGATQIWIMDADGSNQRKVDPASFSGSHDARPSFNPTSDLITYQRTPGYQYWVAQDIGVSDLFGNQLPVPAAVNTDRDEVDPAWSPTGDAIAFQRRPFGNQSGSSDIWLWEGFGSDMTGGTVRQVTFSSYDDEIPNFSSDGRSLTFSRRYSGTDADLWTVDIETGFEQRLTNGPAEDTRSDWLNAQDLAHVAFARDTGGATRGLFIADGSGATTPVPLVGDGDWGNDHVGDPSWSDDGSELAFSWRRGTYGTGMDVFVVSSGGGEPRRLTSAQPSRYAGVPRWSPDGRFIAYRTDEPGQNDLFLACADDANTHHSVPGIVGWRITNTSYEEFEATWSPDGSELIYRADLSESAGALHRVDLSGIGDGPCGSASPTTFATTVVETGLTAERFSDPDWSPDGAHLVFVAGDLDGDADLHVLDLLTGEVEALTSGDHTDRYPTYSINGRDVVFSRERTDGSGGLFTVNTVTGQIRQLTSVAGDTQPSWFDDLKLSVSDGDVAAYPAVVEVDEIAISPRSPKATQRQAPQTAALSRSPLPAPLKAPALVPPLKAVPLDATLDEVLTAGRLRLSPLAAPPRLSPLTAQLRATPDTARLKLSPLAAPLRLSPLAAPLISDAFGSIDLASLGLGAARQADLLAGSSLATRQAHQLTLLDILSDSVAGPRFLDLTLVDISVEGSPLAELGVGLMLMGDLAIDQIGDAGVIEVDGRDVSLCDSIDGQLDSDDCGAALLGGPITLATLQIAGLDFSDRKNPIPANLIRMGDLQPEPANDVPLFDRPLTDYLTETAELSGLTLGEIPATHRCAVVACVNNAPVGGFSDGSTLWEVNQGGAIEPAATLGVLHDSGSPTFADLNLGEIVFGSLGNAVTPLETYTAEALGVIDAADDEFENESPIGEYKVQYVNLTGAALPAGSYQLEIRLPPNMRIDGRFAEFRHNDVALDADDFADSDVHYGVGSESTLRVRGVVALAPGDRAELVVGGFPGVELGTFTASAGMSRVEAATGRIVRADISDRGAIEIVESIDDDDTPADARPLTAGQMVFAHATDADFYSFTAPAGAAVEVTVGNANTGDTDLVVYHPASVGTADPLREPTVAEAAQQPIVHRRTSFLESGEPVEPQTNEVVPLEDLPVAGMSDQRSDADEYVRFRALEADPGDPYIIQVTPHLEGDVNSRPYTLRVDIKPLGAPAVCPPRQFADGSPSVSWTRTDPLLTSLEAETETLVLVDWERMAKHHPSNGVDVDVDDVKSALADFLVHEKVKGQVLDIGAIDAFRAATHVADAAPCDPAPVADQVRAINDHVDTLLASGHELANIVILGSASVVPMAFVPDVTQAGNEIAYALGLRGDLAQATLLSEAGSVVWTDAPYADLNPTPSLNRWLYVPDVALGRVGESPGEIVAALEVFDLYDGKLVAETALAVGADFMQDLAAETAGGLADVVGPTNTSVLVADEIDSASFEAAFQPGLNPAELVSPNLHANHYSFELSDGRFATSDADPDRFAGALMISLGCHANLSVSDVIVGPNAIASGAKVTDWAQTVTGGGGAFAGNSGYGLGMRDSLAYGEKLNVEFARQLARTDSIGEAMVAAIGEYLLDVGADYSVYDEKSAQQFGLSGLPMYEVVGLEAEADPPARPAVVSPFPGFSFDTVAMAVDTDFDAAVAEVLDTGSVFQGPDGVGSAPLRPVLPTATVDLPEGTEARGVFVVSAREARRIESFDPVFTAPSLATATARTVEPAPDDMSWPATPASVRSVGDQRRLVTTPAHFDSTGTVDGSVVGTLTLYDDLVLRVFSSDSDDRTSPSITRTVARRASWNTTDDVVTFDVDASDDASGVAVVSVVVINDGVWREVSLIDGGDGRFTGSTRIPAGSDVTWAVQAADGAGNTASSWNKGDHHPVETVTDLDVGAVRTVASGGTDGVVSYDDVSVVLRSTGAAAEWRLDGVGTEEFIPYSGPITISGSGVHRLDFRQRTLTDSAETAIQSLVVRIDEHPSPRTQILSPPPYGHVRVGEPYRVDFLCPGTGSGNRCKAIQAGEDLAAGDLLDTADLGWRYMIFRADSNAGWWQIGHWYLVWDFDAPTVVINGGALADGGSVLVGAPLRVDFTCADNHGVASCTGELNGQRVEVGDIVYARLGNNTMIARATDRAGLTVDVRHDFHGGYHFDGFLDENGSQLSQPVVRAVAGAPITLRWSHQHFWGYVDDSATVTSYDSEVVACPATDSGHLAHDADAAGRSGVSWQQNHMQLNVGTDLTDGLGCRGYTIHLDDGSSQTITVRFVGPDNLDQTGELVTANPGAGPAQGIGEASESIDPGSTPSPISSDRQSDDSEPESADDPMIDALDPLAKAIQ